MIAAVLVCFAPAVGIDRNGGARGLVEQQRDQRAYFKPQQERTFKSQQQRGVPLREHAHEAGQDAAVADRDGS